MAACTGSGEPSVDNIRDALGGAGNRGATKAEKLACKRSPERPGYVCDYRAPNCNRFSGACGPERPFTGRFLYAGGRWQLVEDLTRAAAPDPATQPLPGVVLAGPTAAVTTPPVVAEPPMPREPEPVPTPEAETEPLSNRDLKLVARWLGEDARCRAGAAIGREGEEACEDRTRTGERLQDRGLCYVRPGGWRRCD